ncbi:MAG: hypothetical protein KF761_13970 [Salinibacterium sp.]|nr:hypothetical protein [Salinibacterium sp.]
MASDLQQLADALRAFSHDTSRVSRDLTSSYKELGYVLRQASELRVDGVDTRKVIDALVDAQNLLARAIEHATNLGTSSRGFADHLATSGGSGGSAQTRPPPGLLNDASNNELTSKLSDLGFELVAVDSFDFAPDAVLGWNHGATPDDAAWAVSQWDTTLAPGIATGATRADFEDYDNKTAAPAMRRLASVWDMFFGSEAMVRDPQASGRNRITNGQHRIASARAAGIRFLPVKKP